MSEKIQTSPSSEPKTQSEKSRWRNMIALSFGYFVDQGEGQAMSVLFPTLRAMWGLSFADLGLVGTIRNLLQSLSAPFWGFIADRYPRKNVIVFGTGIWGIWTLLVGFTTEFWPAALDPGHLRDRFGLSDAGYFLIDVRYLSSQEERTGPGNDGGHWNPGHHDQHGRVGIPGYPGSVALGIHYPGIAQHDLRPGDLARG